MRKVARHDLSFQRCRRVGWRVRRRPAVERTTAPPTKRGQAEPPEDRVFKAGSLGGPFAGFGVGVWAVVLDASQLGVFLAYVGTPTATVIGFYSWKAKAENVVKIKKANPEETEGMPVDLNNVQP